MTIELPDFGAQLGAALDRLGGGLASIVNPDYKFHKAIREAAAADPTIIQKLADMKLTNGGVIPELYKRRLPKDVLDAINITVPSPTAIRTKAATDRAGTLTPGQNSSLGAAALTGDSMTGAESNMAVASLIPSIAQQEPGTPPRTLAEQGAQQEVGKMSAGRSAADVITAQLGPVAHTYMDGVQEYDAKHKTNFFQRMAAEHFSLLDDPHFLESIAARKEIAGERQEDRLRLIQEHEINHWVNKTGIGDPDLWRHLLYDGPKMDARMAELRATGPKTAEDRLLLRMQNFRETQGAGIERAYYIASVMDRDKAMERILGNPGKKIAPATDTTRPSYLEELNTVLRRQHVPVIAYWGDAKPNGENKGKITLRFRAASKDQVEIPSNTMYQFIQRADDNFTSNSSGGFDIPRVEMNNTQAEPVTPPPQPTIETPRKTSSDTSTVKQTSTLAQRRANYANQLVGEGLPPAVAKQRAMNEIQ